jgi:signal transduction histidine kinase
MIRTCLLLVFGSIIPVSAWGQSASKYIVNYGPEVNKSGETIYSIANDKDGLLYIAISKGIMVYDGETWDIYTLNGEGDARSVEYDPYTDRVLVGGLGVFGYLKRDERKRFEYVSLSDKIDPSHKFRQIWIINAQKDFTVFQSHEGFFYLRGDSVVFKDYQFTYNYTVEGDEYYTTKDGPLIVMNGNDTLINWDQREAGRESAFAVYPVSGNRHVIIYPNKGVFVRDRATNKIKVYKPLDALMRKHTMYTSTRLSDSVLAIGTYSSGILITDLYGNVGGKFDRAGGVASNGFYDIEVDRYGKIWGGSEYGICVVDVRQAIKQFNYPPLDPPAALITSFSIDNDTVRYLKPHDTIHLKKSPEELRISFSMPGIEYFSDHQYTSLLEGYDKDWTEPDEPNFRVFNKLKNGTYLLRVKALTKTLSTPEGHIYIVVDEPWYNPFIKISLYAIGGAGVFGLILFGYTYRLRHSQRRLTRLVSEKTKEIEARERELIVINASLRETNEELDTFLYRSSHDLVSPVKSIKGLITLMRMSKEDSELYVNLMDDRISRLENILQEINSYVKNVKRDAVRTRFNMRELIETIWASLEFLDNARGIRFEVAIDPDLEIVSDREQWRMVINNLFSNSIKYHDVSKSSPYIKVTASANGGEVHMVIEDNGQGIRKEHQAKLFDMFFRAHEGSDGTGLGLFLVKKMVDRLGGTITLDSDHGIGTQVHIRVPL